MTCEKMTHNFQKTELEQLYLNRDDTGDITFLVGHRQVRAHRDVLLARFPAYAARLNRAEIRIGGSSVDTFDVFLRILYEETDLTMENIEIVFLLAINLVIQELLTICLNFLQTQIQDNKVCSVYQVAMSYNIETIRESCEYHIKTNTLLVFESNDFLQCDRDTLLHILSIDILNCTEKDVFQACISWAAQRSFNIQPVDLRTALGDAIYHIRFSSFTLQEFVVVHHSLRGFFSADETTEILYMIGGVQDSVNFNGTVRRQLHAYDNQAYVHENEVD